MHLFTEVAVREAKKCEDKVNVNKKSNHDMHIPRVKQTTARSSLTKTANSLASETNTILKRNESKIIKESTDEELGESVEEEMPSVSPNKVLPPHKHEPIAVSTARLLSQQKDTGKPALQVTEQNKVQHAH